MALAALDADGWTDELGSRARLAFGAALRVMLDRARDYGTTNLVMTGEPGIATRIIDKCARVIQVSRRGGSGRTTEDSWIDIINYGILGLLLHEGRIPRMNKVIYFAHPIDMAGSEVMNTATAIRERLSAAGFTIYDPGGAWSWPGDVGAARVISAVNKAALENASAVVAWVPSGTQTLGVAEELATARDSGKPTAVIDDGQCSVFLSTFPNRFREVTGVIEWLRSVFGVV